MTTAFDAERAFARCSQRWAAARCFRNFRTHQQDVRDAKRFGARLRRVLRGGAR